MQNIDSNELLHTSEKGSNIDHQKFAKFMIQNHILASVDSNIFIYKDGIRIPTYKTQIEKLIIDDIIKYIINNSNIKRVKASDKNQIYEFIVAQAEDEKLRNALNERNEYEINYANHIVNHKTNTVRKYTPGDYKFQKLDFDYTISKKQLKPHKMIAFLNDIFSGYQSKPEIISFLQEYIGYLLIHSTKYEKGLLLYGSGANGKGVLLSVIEEIIGKNNVSHVPLHEMHKEQVLYNLFGKLANIDADMQQSVQLDSGIIKKIISGESITGKILYKQPIEFSPTAKLLIATNELPYIKSIDNSIQRRFVFIHLRKSFLGKENPNLRKELLEEKEAIIEWVIEGLKRLLQRDYFEIPKELHQNIVEYLEDQDSVKQFLEDGDISKSKHANISYKHLYMKYKEYCNETGYKPVSSRKLNKRIKEHGYEDYRDSQKRGFLGIGLP